MSLSKDEKSDEKNERAVPAHVARTALGQLVTKKGQDEPADQHDNR